jgi:serine/threonine protein kinase
MPRRPISSGTALDRNITVLGAVEGRRAQPVYIVWNHRAWCPMACKLFESFAHAQREAAVLRAFEHPGIVRCLGTGRAGYMLMEFLEGPTLSRYLRSKPGGRLSVSDALRVAIYLGSALIHMHARGFLHLDVKPSNVIVYRGRPVLFDLDIARRRSRTWHGRIRGTAPYMAPEQCVHGELTRAADVFGLGVTLYQALAGTLPFPEGRGRNRYPQTKVEATPLRDRLPRAPKGLEELLQRCLARHPAERPTLVELMPALHRFISSGPAMWPEGFDPAAAPQLGPARGARRR